MAIWNTINLSEIKPDRFDAEYFRKDYQDNIDYLESTGPVQYLGKLFKYINRGSQPEYSNYGTLKALRSVNIGFMNFNEKRQEYVTEEFYNNSNRGKVQKDDVLITSTGVGTLGRTSIWFNEEKAYCDGHITILRNSKNDPYFVTAFLNSKYGLIQFDQNYRGSSGQIEIYPHDISKFVIPECLFPYQKEIGNTVREIFRLKEESKELNKQATYLLESKLGIENFKKEKRKFRITSLSELGNSNRFDAQCFKPEYLQYEIFIRENNEYSRLSNLLNSILKGDQQEVHKNGKYPYVSIKDIFDKDVISKGNAVRAYSLAQKEDLLLAVTGATIGKIGIVHRYESLSFSGDILGLNVDKNKISPWYLLAVLASPIGQTQCNRWITGSTNGHLSPSDVRKIIIPRLKKEDELQIEKYIKKALTISIKAEKLLVAEKLKVEQLIEEAAR